ncbi:hypothetical protein WOLCODRAFT_80761 [Wolfiporia cocos MD-104 SS10]|uniref:Uncharacterized protein n=1 Tax=Wolfiporia cocos (strain MD-104) TaxID=742152 RepID=A0A2H3JDD3_WOLCO|nr:hypothetical protein WOLCODRAFT_80761 [Wolfiporia cocos MD-104 SS10]
MIITDETPASPSKAQRALEDDGTANTDNRPPPPAYPASGSYQDAAADNGHTGPDQPNRLEDQPLFVIREEPASRRFLKAFGVAALIWMLLAILTRSSIKAVYRNSHRGKVRLVFPHKTIEHGRIGWPTERDGKIIRCVSRSKEWLRNNSGPRASFELPLSADILYMFSRGALSNGEVTFIQSADWTERHAIQVDITIHYTHREQLDGTSVCLLEREAGQTGIGFFTPENWQPVPRGSYFYATVRFPVSMGTPLHIAALETALPRFSHYIGDLEGEVFFESLTLKSTDSPIEAKVGLDQYSVSSRHAEVVTTNSFIRGDFCSSGSLSLINSNGPIRANASLHNDSPDGTAVSLLIKTSNGPITSGITLFSSDSSTGDAFNVSARTSNNALDIFFDESPLDARLDVHARTSNAPAAISMSREFEGSFRLRTTNGYIAVPFNNAAEDPAGGYRLRNLVVERNRSFAEGYVSWNAPRRENGHVIVQTSNAPVTLKLL